MTGARMIVARPAGHQDPNYLVQLIQQEGVTTIHFVPSMLQVFIEEPQAEQCKSLRRVICSGEALGWNLQERFHHRMAGVEVRARQSWFYRASRVPHRQYSDPYSRQAPGTNACGRSWRNSYWWHRPWPRLLEE